MDCLFGFLARKQRETNVADLKLLALEAKLLHRFLRTARGPALTVYEKWMLDGSFYIDPRSVVVIAESDYHIVVAWRNPNCRRFGQPQVGRFFGGLYKILRSDVLHPFALVRQLDQCTLGEVGRRTVLKGPKNRSRLRCRRSSSSVSLASWTRENSMLEGALFAGRYLEFVFLGDRGFETQPVDGQRMSVALAMVMSMG